MGVAEAGADIVAASPFAIALREELRRGGMEPLGQFQLGDLSIDIRSGTDSVWALIRRPGCGGLALRVLYIAGGGHNCRSVHPQGDETLRLEVAGHDQHREHGWVHTSSFVIDVKERGGVTPL
jgi:hypothetical protein